MATNKPTYEELEIQVVELKKQIEILQLNSDFQNTEKRKRTEELIIANIELAFQNKKKEKRAAELVIANIKQAFQNEEKEKITADLIIANLALTLQSELIIAKEKVEENERNLKVLNEEYVTTNEELKQTIEKLFLAKEKAEESDQLKTAFLENISHEVRTPMNAILGFSKLLLKPNIEEKKKKKYTDVLHKSTHQLLSIVDNTLTLAYIETKQVHINKINFYPLDLLTNLLDEYNIKKQYIEKSHIELVLNKTEFVDLKINHDYTRLNQIFNIFLDNALKFTESGTIEFGYNFSENNVNFYVKDTGIGISKNKQQIIFKSFTQADKSIRQTFGGLGVGLSIALGLVKLLEGNLKINSQENLGTEFIITLPIQNLNN